MPARQSAEALLIDPNPDDVRLFLDGLDDEKIAHRRSRVISRQSPPSWTSEVLLYAA